MLNHYIWHHECKAENIWIPSFGWLRYGCKLCKLLFRCCTWECCLILLILQCSCMLTKWKSHLSIYTGIYTGISVYILFLQFLMHLGRSEIQRGFLLGIPSSNVSLVFWSQTHSKLILNVSHLFSSSQSKMSLVVKLIYYGLLPPPPSQLALCRCLRRESG